MSASTSGTGPRSEQLRQLRATSREYKANARVVELEQIEGGRQRTRLRLALVHAHAEPTAGDIRTAETALREHDQAQEDKALRVEGLTLRAKRAEADVSVFVGQHFESLLSELPAENARRQVIDALASIHGTVAAYLEVDREAAELARIAGRNDLRSAGLPNALVAPLRELSRVDLEDLPLPLPGGPTVGTLIEPPAVPAQASAAFSR